MLGAKFSVMGLLTNGNFGELSLHQTVAKVRESLGDPDDVGQGMGRVTIFRYVQEGLELSFRKEHVVLLAVYKREEGPQDNEATRRWRVEWDIPADMMDDVAALSRWLSSSGMRVSELRSREAVTLVVHGGGTALYEEGRLRSVQAS
jgi:hypothetical protein